MPHQLSSYIIVTVRDEKTADHLVPLLWMAFLLANPT
jgi:hypothetical protein